MPLVAKLNRSVALVRPCVPGGRMLRKPPKSFVPYGSGLAAEHVAGASSNATTSAATPHTTLLAMDCMRTLQPPPGLKPPELYPNRLGRAKPVRSRLARLGRGEAKAWVFSPDH